MKFMNDDGPLDPQIAYLDGYLIAERLLEDVLFKIEITDGDIRCTGFHSDSEQLIKNMLPCGAIDSYIKEMEDFAQTHDIFSDADGEDCWIDPPQYAPVKPIQIVDAFPSDKFVDILTGKAPWPRPIDDSVEET